MKNKFLIYILPLFLFCMGLVACSDENGTGKIPFKKEEENIPLEINFATKNTSTDLACNVYVFSKSSDDQSYIYDRTLSNIGTENHTHPYVEEDWNENKEYRFLFLLLPENNSVIEVSLGNSWEDLLIETNTEVVPGDFYYGILDKSGINIKPDTILKVDVNRLVGQAAIDIFRIDDEGNPIDKVSEKVTSVLDRVYQIEIEYTGLTKAISFDADGKILEREFWEQLNPEATQTITVDRDSDLKVSIPQGENIAVSASEALGSVRIKGLYALQSTNRVKLKVTFSYHDTTPYYEDGVLNYEEKELTLYLPSKDETEEFLSFIPNYYTLNKSGIRYDRIIDMISNSMVDFQWTWDNEAVR